MRVTKALATVLCAGMLASSPVPAVADTQATDGIESSDAKYPRDAIGGEWWTENREGRVKFVAAPDGTFTGILTWGIRPHKDTKNKDPKLRDRDVIGIVLMWHLRYEDGEYVDGYVYNPEDGSTYRMKAEVLGPDALEIRGYLGISLFGQSQTWARAHRGVVGVAALVNRWPLAGAASRVHRRNRCLPRTKGSIPCSISFHRSPSKPVARAASPTAGFSRTATATSTSSAGRCRSARP